MKDVSLNWLTSWTLPQHLRFWGKRFTWRMWTDSSSLGSPSFAHLPRWEPVRERWFLTCGIHLPSGGPTRHCDSMLHVSLTVPLLLLWGHCTGTRLRAFTGRRDASSPGRQGPRDKATCTTCCNDRAVASAPGEGGSYSEAMEMPAHKCTPQEREPAWSPRSGDLFA